MTTSDDPQATRDQALARLTAPGNGGVERVTLNVGREQVVLFARSSELKTHCTCGRDDCEHLQAALSWAAGEPAEAPPTRSSGRPSAPGALPAAASELAAALDDVLLAVVRTGSATSGAPSVREALETVVARAPSPTPEGLARWVGRLHASLNEDDTGTVARLLDGAARFSADLRDQDPTDPQLARCTAWLGSGVVAGSSPLRISDCSFMEVGREWITGFQRRSLERRYLVHLGTGEVFREERARGQAEPSIGPCPRVLNVGLAEVDSGGAPRRIRLLQYAVEAEPTPEQWALLEAAVLTRVPLVTAGYTEALRAYPGLAEPFVLFAPASLSAGPLEEPIDAEGACLPLARAENASLVETVYRFAAGREVLWLAGRVMDAGATLMMRPVSMAVRGPDGDPPQLLRVA